MLVKVCVIFARTRALQLHGENLLWMDLETAHRTSHRGLELIFCCCTWHVYTSDSCLVCCLLLLDSGRRRRRHIPIIFCGTIPGSSKFRKIKLKILEARHKEGGNMYDTTQCNGILFGLRRLCWSWLLDGEIKVVKCSVKCYVLMMHLRPKPIMFV